MPRPSLRFYIATRLERAAEANRVRDLLREQGHEITYDWTTHGSVQDDGLARMAEVAEAETYGVLDADVVVMLAPGGRGTHVELGIAIGASKPVILVGPDEALCGAGDSRWVAFYAHPLVVRATTDAELLAVISAYAVSQRHGWLPLPGEHEAVT